MKRVLFMAIIIMSSYLLWAENLTICYQNGESEVIALEDIAEIYFDPTLSVEEVVAEIQKLPLKLLGNHPNPFAPQAASRSSETKISYQLASEAEVTITIYNSKGQKVKNLCRQSETAGKHTISWNGKNEAGNYVAAGVYFYNVEVGKISQSKKMLIIK